MKRVHPKLKIIAGLIFLVTFALNVSDLASATVIPNPSANVPFRLMNPDNEWSIPRCDDAKWKPLNRLNMFEAWISSREDPKVTTVSVAHGATSVPLQYNRLLVNCLDATQTDNVYIVEAQNRIRSVQTGVSGIGAGSVLSASVTNGQYKGAFNQRETDFTYAPAGGFTTSGEYTITIVLRMTYGRSDGTFACANDGTSIDDHADDGKCTDMTINFPIYIDVDPPPTPSGSLGISCNADTAVLTVTANITGATTSSRMDVAATINNSASPSSLSLSNRASGSYTLSPTSQGSFGITYTVTGTVTDSTGTSATLARASVTCPALHWVTGTVRNAYDASSTYSGITIQTCRPTGGAGHADSPSTATSDANGYFAFRVPAGRGFCVGLGSDTLPSGVMSVRLRPLGLGYRECPVFAVADTNPNYCTQNYNSYIGQVSNESAGGHDRNTNNGFDFALRFRPVVSCSISVPDIVEAGASYDAYTPTVTITKGGGVTRPNISSGVVTLRVQGQPNQTWTHSSGSGEPGPLSGSRSHNFNDVIINDPGTYTVNASVTATGDGFSISGDTIDCPAQTLTVGTRPYLKEFGGDVWSGGAITSDTDCSAPDDSPGNIFAFNRGSGGAYSGASAQLTVTALMNVNGFASVGHRASPLNTRAPKGLTFANNDNSALFGGGYGEGAARCITDYFNETRATELDGGTFGGTLPDGRGRVQYESGARTISGLTVPIGTQAAVYIDGNLYINGNIEFAAGATSLSDLPNLALIVRGNIYVDSSVTRLDGLYVAQPRDGTSNSGVIYTCATSSTAPCDRSNALEEGNRQLAINGSLVALRIKWLRTFGSLAGSTNAELPNFATGLGTNAAEVVSYTPEVYLAPSPLELSEGSDVGFYDSIRSLPPVY